MFYFIFTNKLQILYMYNFLCLKIFFFATGLYVLSINKYNF